MLKILVFKDWLIYYYIDGSIFIPILLEVTGPINKS